MVYETVFETFDHAGKLLLPGLEQSFASIPWLEHPTFEGVALKHIVTSEQTDGQFSFHLVRIAPGKAIGLHTHPTQLETHEVIAGSGICHHNETELCYEPGVISLFPAGLPHEVMADAEGLFLFAKFLPALV